MTVELGDVMPKDAMDKSRVRVFLDDDPQPIVDQELPAEIDLDTTKLGDGVHRLTIRATSHAGGEGVEEIPFRVHNGPGIVVAGLRPGSTRRGRVRFTVDAFSADDPFDPRRAEARGQIPVWVWVMSLFVVAWAVWYAARMWDVPQRYAQTPTYAPAAAASTSGFTNPPGTSGTVSKS